MNRKCIFNFTTTNLLLAVSIGLTPQLCRADAFAQTNLVSDVPGMAATTDPNLKNPWGVAFVGGSPFWVSNQASGTTTLYDGAGNEVKLPTGVNYANIPGSTTPPSGPTGQVFYGGTGFKLSNGNPARFIFDTLNGTIAGWNGGLNAIQAASTPGAIYTGLALANSGGSSYLYAADATGQIRVFNSTFGAATLAGNFTDPNALTGYVPFNIQAIGSQLYVTYARLTPQGTALSGGYVDVYNTDGTFAERFATGGPLNGPWGLVMAPASFALFGGDLLIGNFGNGEILAYDPNTKAFLGTLDGTNGSPIVNDFLWALEFRTAGANTSPNTLYFTAGINNQSDGLFGELTSVPEPGSEMLFFLGLTGLTWLGYRRRRLGK
ncbi:MAG: TIGR03118 family protein [Acidobacteriaceae bacterium]|nr:TIGR03118 family protein [Acidobacteriaceae bacterium]